MLNVCTSLSKDEFFGKKFYLLTSTGIFILIGAFQGPALLAQQADTITVKPATVRDLNIYFEIGATSTCVLLMQDVPFKPAVTANAESIASAIIGLHKGEVENLKKLDNNQLLQFSAQNLILRAADICFDKLPVEARESLKKIKSQSESKPKP